MRIALVVTGGVDPSGRDRVIPSLLSLIERTARRHELFVYVLRYFATPQRYSLLGATVQDLGRPDGIRRQSAALSGAINRDGPFDLLHAYWALPAGLASTLVAAKKRIPSIVTLDSGEFVSVPDIGYGLRRTWQQRLGVASTCRIATRLTVCTRFYAELAAPLAVDIIPLGVDTSLFVPPMARAGGPPWSLLHVASLNKVKDQPLLLETMRRLLDEGVDARLDIVGEDTLDGDAARLASALGISSRVTFHGFRRSADLVPFYQRAHVAILTSRHEAAGVVTLEAAACGVPTVGTRVGYVADWSGDKAVAARADASAIANAVGALLADPRRRERLAAEARAWTVAHNADWTAAQFDRLYHATADRRGSSHSERSRPINA